jgi:hypothetical protein
MAKRGSADFGFLLVGGYSLLASEVFDVSLSAEAVTEESHGLGKSWAEHLATGLKRVTFSQSGLFDDDAAGVAVAMVGQNMVSRIVALTFEGNVLGRAFVGLAGAFGAVVERVSQRGALHRLNVTYTVTGTKDEGVILEPDSARTVSWTGAAVDNAVLTSNGGAGHLQVTAYSGLTGVVAKVQHSVDNSVWVDLVTFTNVTSAPNAQRIAVSGTVNRWLRSIGTVTGTGSITVMSGFARS